MLAALGISPLQALVVTGLSSSSFAFVLWLGLRLSRSRAPRLSVLTSEKLRRATSVPASPPRTDRPPPPTAPTPPPPETAPPVPGSFSPRLRKRPCRWRRDRLPPETRLIRWVCASCGVEAYAMGRTPPRECKRALRNPSL